MLNRLRPVALIAVLFVSAAGLEGQQPPRTIPSLTEPGVAMTIRDVSPRTGFVTFASAPEGGILLNVDAGAPAETRASSFVDSYGKWFGLEDASHARFLRASAPDELGVEHVRLQQTHRGVPVRGGELVVHLAGSRVVAANGHATNDLPPNLSPATSAATASAEAKRLLEKIHSSGLAGATYGEPRLEIFNRGLLSDPGESSSRLAWFVEVSGPAMREFVWVDAQTGEILLNFSQLTTSKSREIYTANHTSSLPGTLLRTEGGAATGDTDADDAYSYAGITYDYYSTNHGRDSYDDAGATIVSTVHYCEPPDCPSYPNAFWSSSSQQMAYGDSYASADDVVGHEITHAVTEYSADLFYYMQSGALNESFSDILGEAIDLSDGVGNDTAGVRWLVGEDLPIGAIRNMMDPNAFSDPAKMSDSTYFFCGTGDNGGVHINSGIPNHAFALMVDGGTYNGKTVTAIGLTKAEKIQYRSLTAYLTSGSGFIDNYNALNQSCTDLIGVAGISTSDCTEVNDALLAVEMNAAWGCSGAVLAPALCPSGIPSYLQFDGFEVDFGNWTATTVGSSDWVLGIGAAHEGTLAAYGLNEGSVSDHRLTMTNDVAIPAGARLYFDHMFEFEDETFPFDGGVLEYSTDGGSSWTDAATLIDAGETYGGTLSGCCSNPLAGRSAFVNRSFGYTGTRLTLASLAGQNFRFRFRVGTDTSFGALGWLVDNAALYTCVSSAFTDDPLVAASTIIKKTHITELRSRIDSARIRNGLAAFAWTDPVLTIGTTNVKAVHITEMRTALAAAYTEAGVTPPTYTDPGLTTGTVIGKVHIAELREAVIALE